jgi:hypothetical protein
MQKTKAVRLPNATINYNQLRLAEPNLARDGRAKRTHVPEIAWGMKSQSRPDGVHPFLHGQALSDETADKLSQGGHTVPVHSGMGSKTPEHRGAADWPGHSSTILARAPSLEKHGEARLPQKK